MGNAPPNTQSHKLTESSGIGVGKINKQVFFDVAATTPLFLSGGGGGDSYLNFVNPLPAGLLRLTKGVEVIRNISC